MLYNLLLVGLGGGLGSMARYLCQRWFAEVYPHSFPWGTFAVNITGVCGGFTTFSAFTLEGIGLLREQKTALFFAYIAASVLLGLLATYAGMKLTR